jgi:hypothetical protein
VTFSYTCLDTHISFSFLFSHVISSKSESLIDKANGFCTVDSAASLICGPCAWAAESMSDVCLVCRLSWFFLAATRVL